jgi:hypothetical protein
MTLDTLIQSKLWHEFEQYARSKRKQPAKLLAEIIRDRLEIAEDVALNEAIRRDVRKSGYNESDAVKIVCEYRAEKRKRSAAS